MVRRYFSVTWILFILAISFPCGNSLMCFHCENHMNPSCGEYFKPYQFKPIQCPGRDYKCALQREPAAEKDGWVGIIRNCYQLGALPGINDTDGCKNWTIDGFTALFCFCNTNFCNTASANAGVHVWLILLTIFICMYIVNSL